MPDENCMAIVRPNTCHDCGNGYYALGHVVDYARELGWNVIDLSDEQSRQQPVYDALDNYDPLFFYGFGHGGPGVFTTQGEPPEVVFMTEQCDRLSGRINYFLSCLTANNLGPAIMDNDALTYAGFLESWWWVSLDTESDPYDLLYARCFFESANELWIAICDGESFSNAVLRSIERYNDWIDYWFWENPGAPYSQDCIMYLAIDRDALLALFNCEKLGELECADMPGSIMGCDWDDGCISPVVTHRAGTNPIPLMLSLAVIAGLVFFSVK